MAAAYVVVGVHLFLGAARGAPALAHSCCSFAYRRRINTLQCAPSFLRKALCSLFPALASLARLLLSRHRAAARLTAARAAPYAIAAPRTTCCWRAASAQKALLLARKPARICAKAQRAAPQLGKYAFSFSLPTYAPRLFSFRAAHIWHRARIDLAARVTLPRWRAHSFITRIMCSRAWQNNGRGAPAKQTKRIMAWQHIYNMLALLMAASLFGSGKRKTNIIFGSSAP